MHSTDAARRNAGRRPDLNINTSIAASKSMDPIPQTPPPNRKPPLSAKGKSTAGGWAARMPGSSTTRDSADIQTFIDSITPIDMSNKENDRPEPPQPNPRDSHDLSLPSRQVTRDSLVTNMLLSLDQLSMTQLSNQFTPSRVVYDDMASSPPYGMDEARAMTFNSRSGRSNGHGYSYSSDLEGADDSSRISSQPSRGRRSNSSSGFQSSLGRINSMRESSRHGSLHGASRPIHSRGGKGSKSSSSASIDAGGYAQVLGSQRWAQGFARRSSSFDYGPPTARSAATSGGQLPWHIEFSNSFFSGNRDDDHEAAPTPTIPVGPRRLATVPSMPVMPPSDLQGEPKSPLQSPGMERKRSTRSSRSVTVGRKPDMKFHNSHDVPPVPTFDLDSAPAPHIAYEKSKEAVVHGAPAPVSQPAKQEKPGFFRRMFGASRNTPNNPPVDSINSPHVSSTSVETASSKPHHAASQVANPPSRESHTSTTHTLQKKTSSFFRRRKQSFTDADPPPLPVLPIKNLPPEKERLAVRPDPGLGKPQPSPATSLRRVMDPFLHGDPSTPTGLSQDMHLLAGSIPKNMGSSRGNMPSESGRGNQEDEDDGTRERNSRGFSPDYEPSPKALIRTVDPEPIDLFPRTPADSRARLQAPTGASVAPVSAPQSFLQDNSSDSEDSPKKVKPKNSRVPSHARGLKPEEVDLRSRSPSPAMAKSKSSPNLRYSREDLELARQLNPMPGMHNLGLPIDGGRGDGAYKSGVNVPSLKVDSAEPSPNMLSAVSSVDHSQTKSIDEPELFVLGDPTEDDRQKALKIFSGNEDFIQKEKAAAWMGEEGPVRQRTLRAYMDLYDFRNQSIVTSLRQVCGRLILKAETQQIDRILVAFSNRWCECNPNHGFKATDTIHTICYSIMLLNTDLHMADVDQKMTRSQFLKNTMTTIRQSLEDSAPEAFERPTVLPGKGHMLGIDRDGRTSNEDIRGSIRLSIKPPPRPDSALGGVSDQVSGDECGPLVKAPFDGTIRAWEAQVEIVLKQIYASIRDERLPLYGAEPAQVHTPGGLSVMNMLKRSPSVLSKAPSEGGVPSVRGRVPEAAKSASSRWASKSRSRPRVWGGNGMSSSRTSLEDSNSLWSPTESSATWSRYSLGRTQTTMSMDSFGSAYPRGDYPQAVGFANALNQAIIREDNPVNAPSVLSDELKGPLLEDESLELTGPPWVKEGMVTHKHHLDGIDKKAKDRNWTQVFAVIQKGQLSIFSFSPNKSVRNKSRSRYGGNNTLPKGAVVGGGNWQENATNMGTYSLRQALASALPPPGYSRSRPHVWALSLPTGAVHLFQVGTPEISKEFVNTANYWSARLSTHPLIGGISNIEYGWSEAIICNPLVAAINESSGNLKDSWAGTGTSGTKGHSHSRSGSAANAAGMIPGGRPSLQSRGSIRSSSIDHGRPGSGGSGAISAGLASLRHGGKLPGDSIHVADWTPPTQSMRASQLGEREQLDMLLAYVNSIEQDLQAHNALRSPMLLAFSPRGPNAQRAMANWQRRSEYLLREIVKFRTYVDSLQQSDVRKAEVYGERELARRAARGEEVASLMMGDDESDGNGEEDDQGRGRWEMYDDKERDEGDDTLRPE